MCRCTTQAITRQQWEPPKNKCSELKSYDKPSAIQEINRRGRSRKKADYHGGGTSPPVPTGGPVDRIFTGVSAHHTIASIYKMRGDRLNRPRVKCNECDGALPLTTGMY